MGPSGEMRLLGGSLITAALVGRGGSETDVVGGLFQKGLPTSAYNFKAIVNTVEKVNWTN